MSKYVVFVFFLFFSQFGVAQSNPDNYELKIDFEPAFIKPSQVTIKKRGNSASLNFKIFDSRKKNILEESDGLIKRNELKTLDEFLKSYKFKIKGSIDTIGTEKELVMGDSVVKYYDIMVGTDGITVKGTLTQDDNSKHFAFWSPKEGTKNAELISIISAILRRTFIERGIANYLESLREYFPLK